MILKPQDKEEILKIAKQVFKTPLEVLAYGSRVDGTAHEGSDLDLVLRSKNLKPIDIKELTDFKNKLSNSSIPIIIQFLDWATIPEYFRQTILKKHVVLYTSTNTDVSKTKSSLLK